MTPPINRSPAIQVNGEIIYADEIRARMSVMRAEAESDGRELTAEQRFALRPRAIEDLIDRMLMRQESLRLKLEPTDAEIDVALAAVAPKYDGSEGCRADAANTESREDITSRLMVDRLLSRWLAGARPPKIHECRDFYRRNQQAFHTPELIAASHIVKHTNEGEDGAAMLAEVRSSILAGEDFAAASKRFSDCPENGGDLGYFPRGVMIDEFDAVAFAAPVGEVTEPFHTQFGWHIVLVRDRKPEGIRTFDEVSTQIHSSLLRERQEREVSEKLQALRAKAQYVELGRL